MRSHFVPTVSFPPACRALADSVRGHPVALVPLGGGTGACHLHKYASLCSAGHAVASGPVSGVAEVFATLHPDEHVHCCWWQRFGALLVLWRASLSSHVGGSSLLWCRSARTFVSVVVASADSDVVPGALE